METLYERTLSAIEPLDVELEKAAWLRLDNLTKPQGSLGRLEELAAQFAAVRGDVMAKVEKPAIITFGADHGIADAGVSAFPKEVSVQMAANIASGGAGVSVLARHAGASLRMVDVGLASDCGFPGVVNRKVAYGTADFSKGPAMNHEQCRLALEAGIAEALLAVENGANVIGTGDLGIANTSSSAALYSAYLGVPVEEIAGRGTGIDDARLKRKVELIRAALEINKASLSDPFATLAALGGLEIAAICGCILGAASKKALVLVDGFISGAAAVAAVKIKPEVMGYCVFSHYSAEGGHRKAMNALGAAPLFCLNLRLGEGTGAALAIGILEAGNKILREMATFSEAGVSEKS